MKVATLLLAAMVLIALVVCPVTASTQVAAQYAPSSYSWAEMFYNNYVLAQTFVPTISGTLSSIQAPIHTSYGGDTKNIPISFEIRSTYDSGLNGWQPNFGVAALATGSVAANDPTLNGFFIGWVNVPMTPYELQAGQRYAIVASALGTDSAYEWYSDGIGSAYPDGTELTGYAGDTIFGQQDRDLAFQVNVAISNQPPVLTLPTSPLTGVVGSQVTFPATATDPDAGDTLTFSLSGEPSGAVIDQTSGVFTWTPTSAGTYTFDVTVTDSAGLSDTKQMAIEVSALAVTDATVMSRNSKVTTVCVYVENLGTATAYDVQVTGASLDGVATNSSLPLLYGAIKPGDSKKVMLQFKNPPSGGTTLTVQGTCSLGEFISTQKVTVP